MLIDFPFEWDRGLSEHNQRRPLAPPIALLASGNFCSLALVLDDKDVLLLLKAAIEQEGSISAFAKRHGQQRTSLNNMLNGKRTVSASLAKALGLQKVYVPQQDET